MKAFYGGPVSEATSGATHLAGDQDHGVVGSLYIGTRARVAVYDGPASAPYVEDIPPGPARDYIERLAGKVFDLARSRGGQIPYTVVREVAENLVHAGFAEPVVSVLDSGNTIRFSDQGPGIADKARALQPGFTTASSEIKEIIRGVGSGLPIVRDFLAVSGGRLTLEDNLGGGSVVTMSVAPSRTARPEAAAPANETVGPSASSQRGAAFLPDEAVEGLFDSSPTATLPETAGPWLSKRQKQVLALVLESGVVGPSIVSRELNVGLSTAYRDLASLEEFGLISSEGGKRTLTPAGLAFLGDMSSSAE